MSDINKLEKNLDRNLRESVKKDEMALAEYLLYKEANLHQRDKDGRTLLHHSVSYNHKEMTEFLIKNGLDVNGKDLNGCTPLHYAAFSNSDKVVELLLENGANLYEIAVGVNAFHMAIVQKSYKVADILYKKDNDLVNTKDVAGNYPLHLFSMSSKTTQEAKTLVSKIIQDGADVNVKDPNGNTPLHLAAENNALDIMDILIKSGCKINARNNYGQTPLYNAAWICAKPKTIVKLLENGADVSILDDVGMSAYDVAGKLTQNVIDSYSKKTNQKLIDNQPVKE